MTVQQGGLAKTPEQGPAGKMVLPNASQLVRGAGMPLGLAGATASGGLGWAVLGTLGQALVLNHIFVSLI